MRTALYQLILLIAGILVVPVISGQSKVVDFDSVALFKPEISNNLYMFFDRGAKEIQLFEKHSKVLFNDKGRKQRRFGNKLITAATGIGYSVVRDGTWEISGTIQCNDSLPDWRVNFYCGGEEQTTNDKVRNVDGTFSIETENNIRYYWDKKATGLLCENDDTIGSFMIIMNPIADTSLKYWCSYINSQKIQQDNTQNTKQVSSFMSYSEINLDYGIKGKYRGKSFIFISNGTDFKTWFFIDNKFTCMFQSDCDYIKTSRKNRIMPYLLINKNTTDVEKRYLFRFAIMSRFLNKSISKS